MKIFIFAVFVFTVSLFIGGTALSADSKGNINNTNCFSAVQVSQYVSNSSNEVQPPYIYVRVLIDGHWWTFVYELDGSFVVAIPDEDE